MSTYDHVIMRVVITRARTRAAPQGKVNVCAQVRLAILGELDKANLYIRRTCTLGKLALGELH